MYPTIQHTGNSGRRDVRVGQLLVRGRRLCGRVAHGYGPSWWKALDATKCWKVLVNAAFYTWMMKKRPGAYPPNDPPRRVLDAIREGRRTWEEIAAATRLSDSRLGLIFIDLLARKKVKIVYREGVRLYLPL